MGGRIVFNSGYKPCQHERKGQIWRLEGPGWYMQAFRTMTESRNNLFLFSQLSAGIFLPVGSWHLPLTFSLGDSGKSCTENLMISRWWVIEVLPAAARDMWASCLTLAGSCWLLTSGGLTSTWWLWEGLRTPVHSSQLKAGALGLTYGGFWSRNIYPAWAGCWYPFVVFLWNPLMAVLRG